ncbi:hypothetical protein BJY00DRAFT_290513 [Aspergillus carlsbadensis]|nr:hypothetical protein BJY00DRAFT_290513 [Aspergillus carlsbadensis]
MSLDLPDNTPDRGQGVVILCIIIIALTTLVTIVRIISKFVTRQYWWWDDIFAVLALLFGLILLSLILVWRNYGLGYHADIVAANDPRHLARGAQFLYIAIFFFDGSICLPKLSALFFYARIFGTNNRTFKIHLYIAGTLTTSWLLSAWISTLLECRPLARVWSPMLPGTCIDTYSWYLTTAILSSLIDLYILLLPVRLIWTLRISLRRRIYVLVTFFMAYSVIVLSICRIVAIVRTVPDMRSDLTWEMPIYLYWVLLEVSISIISISVPSGLALFKALARQYQGNGRYSVDSRSQDTNRAKGPGQPSTKNSSASTQSSNERDIPSKVIADTDVSRPGSARGEEIALGRITVLTDIRVETERAKSGAQSGIDVI